MLGLFFSRHPTVRVFRLSMRLSLANPCSHFTVGIHLGPLSEHPFPHPSTKSFLAVDITHSHYVHSFNGFVMRMGK